MLGKIEFEGQPVDFVDPNKQNLIAEVSTKVRNFPFVVCDFVSFTLDLHFSVILKSSLRQKSSSRSARVEGLRGTSVAKIHITKSMHLKLISFTYMIHENLHALN